MTVITAQIETHPMCGILLCIGVNPANEEILQQLAEQVDRRGPTCNKTIIREIGTESGNLHGWFHSSVLSLRPPLAQQPLIDGQSILQYNGEIYNKEIEYSNDTNYVARLFQSDGVLKTLGSLRGEYAFTYYDGLNTLWFARDCIGRRSLLYKLGCNEITICSVSPEDPHNWREAPGGVVFELRLDLWQLSQHSWTHSDLSDLSYPYTCISPVETYIGRNSTVVEQESERKLKSLLHDSTSVRLMNIPDIDLPGAKIGLLFSGGLDCTLIAYLADQILPPKVNIDLLNVAFENKRSGHGYNTPDRLLGLRSWKELVNAAKHPRRFRFIEINVPYEETLLHRPIVQRLMFPKNTVMDLSIAIAFYFASRGKGQLFKSPDLETPSISQYSSDAAVLFSGLGADELFGGYTRHANALRRNTYQELSKELQLDFDRLHERNLGRDDRVCACWGKEVRYPYLDEDLVAWAMACPLSLKVRRQLDTSKGAHSKYILRKIAYNCGLVLVSEEKKRAIQFGAKSAKMEVGSSKSKGQDLL